MRYRMAVAWGGWAAGAILTREELAGCNMTMLAGRGVLQPVIDQPRRKRKPVDPATDTADEPEEQ